MSLQDRSARKTLEGAIFLLCLLTIAPSAMAQDLAAEDHLVGDEIHGFVNLLLGSGPTENGLDLFHGLGSNTGRLGNVGLLSEVLGDECLGVLYRASAVGVDGADDELGSIDILE